MFKSKYLLLCTLSLLTSLSLQAQFLDYGTDPSRFKWNIVRLPHYNLVYPQGADSMAHRYARYLENTYLPIQKTLGKPMQAKFPVILHPGNMSPNGLVSWAPRRMELLTTPSSNVGTQQWDKHLVLHEARHVIQTGKVMHGLFKPLYYLIGEQAAGVASFFLPTWFLEGDAVSTETAMSNGGRGRLPEFNMNYRAQIMAGHRNFSFDKWLLGSYKDYTGTFYALGYNMSSYARQQYGADIWEKTTDRYVKNLLFGGSFKHYTGSGFKRLYNDTFTHLRQEWAKLDSATFAPTYHLSTPKTYTDYRYPQQLSKSTLIAVKSGLKNINSLVSIAHGKEKRLTYLGNINSRLTLRNGRVYWTEITPGIRWRHESYSELKCYDIATDRVTTLTSRQRYLAPDIDKEETMAAVSRSTMAGENQLVLVNLTDGKELAQFDVPENAFIKELTFAEEGTVIAVTVGDKGVNLLQLQTTTGTWKELLKTTSINISSPSWKEGKLLFESGVNGTNNIYSLNPTNGEVLRLTSSQFGAFDPTFSTTDGRLYFADYQAKGYRIASLPTDSLSSNKVELGQPTPLPFADMLAAQEEYNLDSVTLQPVDFRPERFRKGAHTFKIHSWAPFYYDVNKAVSGSADDLTTLVKPGAMILSQNTLNTAIMQAGWFYHEGYHHGKVAFTYQGWFPIIDLSLDYGGKAIDVTWTENDKGNQVAQGQYVDRNQLTAEARVYLPFNLTKNQRIRGIQPSLTYYITNSKYQQITSRSYRHFQYILPEVRLYDYRRQAARDILPRTGYQLRLQYLTSPFNAENYGSLYAARLTTYWPGILQNQGIMLRFGYQYQQLEGKALYLPQQLLDGTRGYNYLHQTRQQWAFKIDYALPLLYPDVNIGSLIYIRRLRANLFYDLTRNQPNEKGAWSKQSSYGTDLVFDWNVLRMTYPIATGVRLTQPIDYGRFQAEMLFSVSF